MVSSPSATLLWAVRIPGGELLCLTWQVAGQWCVGIFDHHEMYVQTTAADGEAACRWAMRVRREIDKLGLGECPVFDPDIDVDIGTQTGVTIDPFEPYDTFDEFVGDSVSTCTALHTRRH